jgi:DNA repair protein RadA/Sms
VKSSAKKSVYACQGCGHKSPRWLGRCPACGEWNRFVEEIATAPSPRRTQTVASPELARLADIEEPSEGGRLKTGTAELDRVLGGGLVAGSAVLLGGDPGIGKSTIALQLAGGVASLGRQTVLYVAGEEAPSQVKLRASRLEIHSDGVLVLAVTDTPAIAAAIREHRPAVAVIDSIQTVHTPRVESAPGSVAQLREATAELVTAAREQGTSLVLVGHVTKEGAIAGPRVLEHMVDTVLYFEGDKNHVFRILRAVKNRFGPANEIGVFEMLASGLREVTNPSAAFTGSLRRAAAGSVVTSCIEGSRPLLVEVQALVAPSLPGSARRTALGIDHGRIAMLAAVMERRLGLAMIAQDIFVNTLGGVRIDDPGTDLAVVAALASSCVDRVLPVDLVVIGEVALTGEVRAVGQVRTRLAEASRLGFRRAVVPATAVEAAVSAGLRDPTGVETVEEAWEALRALSASSAARAAPG